MNLNSTFLNNLAGEGVIDIVNNFRKEWREEDRYNEKQKLLQKRLDEQARSRNNAMVNKYLDKLPEGVDINKVGPRYRDPVTQWGMQQKSAYTKAAACVANAPAGSEQQMRCREKLNSIVSSFENLNAKLENFKGYKSDYLETIAEGNLSRANSEDKMGILSQIYTDGMDIAISENGDLSFYNDSGYINFDDLPDYNVKANNAATSILEMNEALYKSGIAFSPSQENLYRLKLQKLMNQRNIVQSLASDDFIIPGGLGLPNDLLLNDQRVDELRDVVINSYLDMFKQTAAAGAQLKQTRNQAPRSRGTASERKYNAMMNNLLQGWNGLLQGDATLINQYLVGTDQIIAGQGEAEGLYELWQGNNVQYLDPTNPSDLATLFNAQNIPQNLWPDFNQLGNTQQNTTARDADYYLDQVTLDK